jgi:hypothetical protein
MELVSSAYIFLKHDHNHILMQGEARPVQSSGLLRVKIIQFHMGEAKTRHKLFLSRMK